MSKAGRPFRVIAHRGDSTHYPENTLAAFASAIALGADEIECDVRVTRDGVPVIHHDATLRRVLGVDALVSDLSCAEVLALVPTRSRDGGAEVRVPTLEQMLDAVGGIPLQIELKEPSAVAATVAALRARADASLYGRVILTSFHRDLILAARALDDRLSVGWLMTDDHDVDPAACDAAGIASVMPHWRRLTSDVVSAAQRAGLSVRAWGVKDLACAQSAIAAGADGCTYDDPRELLAHLTARGARPHSKPLPPLAQVGKHGGRPAAE
ncbi:MAG: glycerophosphodiester phosphodiesterase [Planctomycetes bacterium]|nr:glycerophosphodiester phosphodiesterase [Planctomycetota bacterium]